MENSVLHRNWPQTSRYEEKYELWLLFNLTDSVMMVNNDHEEKKNIYFCSFHSSTPFLSRSLTSTVLIIQTNQRAERIKGMKYLNLCEEFILWGQTTLWRCGFFHSLSCQSKHWGFQVHTTQSNWYESDKNLWEILTSQVGRNLTNRAAQWRF